MRSIPWNRFPNNSARLIRLCPFVESLRLCYSYLVSPSIRKCVDVGITFYLSYETVCDAPSVDNGSSVASPKIFWAKMFDFRRIKHYFVLDPASQSTQWPYVLNIWGGKANRWLRLWTADQGMVECILRHCITSLSCLLTTMWCGPDNVIVVTEASKAPETPHKRRLRCPDSDFPCCIETGVASTVPIARHVPVQNFLFQPRKTAALTSEASHSFFTHGCLNSFSAHCIFYGTH